MRKSIIGRKFGELTVKEYDGVKNKNSYWICECSCGKKVSVIRTNLVGGKQSTCGWTCDSVYSLKGKSFGKLKVKCLDRMENDTSYWRCKCKCGNFIVVKRGRLVDGGTKSCGCARRGKSSKKWKGMGDISGTMFGNIKAAAKRRKIKFDVSINYLWKLYQKQEEKCALTGMILTMPTASRAVRKGLGTASVDRINSAKGYVRGNVQWVLKDINFMKQQFQQDYFLSLCEKVVKWKVAV